MTFADTVQILGSIGELIGGMAVIATLIYLATQVRQTRELMQGQAYQNRAWELQDIYMRMAESDSLCEVLVKLQAHGFPDDPAAAQCLSELERIKYFHYLRANLRRLDNLLYQSEQGLLAAQAGVGVAHALLERWLPQFRAFAIDAQQDSALEERATAVLRRNGAAAPRASRTLL